MYAISQGALAVECRADDDATLRMLHKLTHYETLVSVIAERAFLRKLVSQRERRAVRTLYSKINSPGVSNTCAPCMRLELSYNYFCVSQNVDVGPSFFLHYNLQ